MSEPQETELRAEVGAAHANLLTVAPLTAMLGGEVSR